MARKRTLHAINLIAPLALVATWFKVSVDAGADAGYSTSMILREFKSCGVPDSRHVFQRNGQFGLPADVKCHAVRREDDLIQPPSFEWHVNSFTRSVLLSAGGALKNDREMYVVFLRFDADSRLGTHGRNVCSHDHELVQKLELQRLDELFHLGPQIR
jgi:hypothetical protein